MFWMISFFVVISLLIICAKFVIVKNPYEKILSFYLIFTHIVILIIMNSVANFDSVLDVVIMLILLELVAVLFLIFNRKKI